MESGGSAFGSGFATGHFDVVAFLKKPQVIIRFVGWVFAIVVFGCISDQSYNYGVCAYNNVASACGYGIAVGVIAFLVLMAFIASDALFDNISNLKTRGYIVLADVITSGVMSFLWLVCFCYLTDLWRRSVQYSTTFYSVAGTEAALAFSFFSILIFVALTVLAGMRYRQGFTDIAQPATIQNVQSVYNETGDTQYRPSPFTNPDSKPLPGTTSAIPY